MTSLREDRDRSVFVSFANGLEIVRYDRRGQWYEESPGQRKRITIGQAVEAALLPGANVRLFQAGGQQFDSKLRRRRGF